ncbi:MAG: shikimate dehydrogenase [Pseudomonadota bacterium]
MLTGAGKVAGVVGWPIAHSLSPLLHGYWLDALKIDGALVPLAISREDFARVIGGLQRAGFRGVNVTVPHKEAAFALAHFCDAAATAAGAANLLVFHADGRIEGRNTDTVGLTESVRERMGSLQGRTIILLGAGGAGRAAVLALDGLDAAKVHLLNRQADKAVMLARSLQPAVRCEIMPGGLEDWGKVAPGADFLINATSAGMKGNPPLRLDLAQLPGDATVLDIVYNPLETELLKQAKARGLATIDGLGMLMHQAVPSFEAFFAVKPEVTAGLRACLEQALQHA